MGVDDREREAGVLMLPVDDGEAGEDESLESEVSALLQLYSFLIFLFYLPFSIFDFWIHSQRKHNVFYVWKIDQKHIESSSFSV